MLGQEGSRLHLLRARSFYYVALAFRRSASMRCSAVLDSPIGHMLRGSRPTIDSALKCLGVSARRTLPSRFMVLLGGPPACWPGGSC